MEYKKKYLKYKAKYLYLKKQIGGERTVQIYDKENYKNLLYKIQLDDDDDIEVLKNKLRDLEKEKKKDFDDIEIFEKLGPCGKQLNAINDKMSEFCMLVRRKQEFPKMKLTTGFSLVDTPIENITSDFNSTLIYSGIVGVFRGKVNKGNQIKGTPFINLEDGEGEYNGSYGSTSIKLVGHFINNKLNGEGNKKISFDDKRHECEYTGFFENNELIRGKINCKISDSDYNTKESSREGTFDFKDRREIIKEGTMTRHDGIILKGTFINNTLNGNGEKIMFFKDNPYQYIYKGLFKNNSLINGVLTNNFSSDIYEGIFEFINGRDVLKEGKLKRNGKIYEGTFDYKFSDTKITTKDDEIYFIRRNNGEIYKLTSLAKIQSRI